MSESLVSYRSSIDDYELVANDYRIVEFINGDIIVTPPPNIVHQRISMEISNQLVNFLKGTELEVFASPIGMKLPDDQILEPDIVVVEKKDAFTKNYIIKSPELVIEILSPSTEHRDRGIKMSLYEKFKIKEYWIVDPDTHLCTQYHLAGEKYVKGDEKDFTKESIVSQALHRFVLNPITL